MTLSLLAYVAACVLLAATPGPNMSLIIASTLQGGLRAGLAALAGALSGLIILVSVAALGMTSVMVFMADWFDVIRWVGAVYLIVLGVRQIRQYLKSRSMPAPVKVSTGSRYAHGLAVSLSNPKVLLFLGAFFPQFVDPSRDPGPQLALLAVLFVTVLAMVDLTYTLLIARARQAFDMRRLATLDAAAGGLLIAGGLVLATARRP
jgi:threonine/homoserine/homoserine lactone efflux protein